jgi:hypothetical protein
MTFFGVEIFSVDFLTETFFLEESSEDEGLNPDQPFLPSTTPLSSSTKEQHDTTVHNEDDEEDNRSSSSSTDSLTPYDLDDDLSDVKTVQTPRYLRECIVALSSDEPDVLEVALRTLPTLIRQHPDELGTFSFFHPPPPLFFSVVKGSF